MLKETEKTAGLFGIFLSLVTFQLGGGPPGYRPATAIGRIW